jgi:hypothetical protein
MPEACHAPALHRLWHAAGALLSALPLLAAASESRWRAGFKEFLKDAGSAVAGAGLAVASTADLPLSARPDFRAF